MEIEYKEIGKCLPYMDRDKLYEERDSIMAEQRKLSSRIKVLDRVLRATTDELADLYLTPNIEVATKTTIKGIVYIIFHNENVYLIEGKNNWVGPLSIKAKVSYQDYVKLEQHKLDLDVIEGN